MTKSNQSSRPQGRSLRVYLAVLVLGLAGLGDDCDGDIVNDPTFRDWCGDTLCAWTLDAGQINRVPTWDANDLGVAFVSTPTQISQVTAENSAKCILFTTVANIDPMAQMSIGVDFDDDGTIDRTVPLGATQWQNVQVEITAPDAYQGIRFVLRKDGTGTAVLAEMRIQSTTGCSAPAVVLPPRDLGEPCTIDTDCATDICAHGVCSQCDTLLDTPSLMEGQHPCPTGVQCAIKSLDGVEIDLAALPLMCGPGERLGMSGAGCVSNDDCISGQCNGAVVAALGADAGACDLNATDAGANCEGYEVHGGTCK